MTERDLGGLRAILGAAFLLGVTVPARAQTAGGSGQAAQPVAATPATGATGTDSGSNENLTVLGHHSRFQPAPMPGAPMGPPPDKPAPHLGRYKISGDQSKKDGYDTQTGAYIAPFGSAYTAAGPVADGVAAHHEGVGGSGP